jgi:hypothetical protein
MLAWPMARYGGKSLAERATHARHARLWRRGGVGRLRASSVHNRRPYQGNFCVNTAIPLLTIVMGKLI